MQAREQLDRSLAKLKPLADTLRPVHGWLRAIRSGLGLTGVEAARRLGVQPPRVVEMEKNEITGAITLKVLERAAEAMGCKLVYALIPRAGSLQETLRRKTQAHNPDFIPATGPDLFDPEQAHVPLSAAASAGLRLPHLSTRGELHLWESQAIGAAQAWAFANDGKPWPSERWIRKLHGRMFASVWKGAGSYRLGGSDRGAPPREIPDRVLELCENVRHWVKAGVYAPDEACARFHHRLWSIRPFDRGNGRLARLLADLLATRVFGRPRFSWGAAAGDSVRASRSRYAEALRAADGRDYKPLLACMRA